MNTSTVVDYVAVNVPVNDAQKRAYAGVAALCLVLGYAAAVTRFLTLQRSGEKLLVQNWTFRVAILLFTAFVAASIASLCFGDQLDVVSFANSNVASAAFYISTLVLLRISMLYLYQHMLFHETRYWLFSIILGGTTVCYSLIFILAEAFQCKPHGLTNGIQCLNTEGLQIAIGVFDFIANAVVLAMPVQAMWQGRQHPDIRNRIYYPIAFVLGFIACTFSLVHAAAPGVILPTYVLLYPLTALLTLTFFILAFAALSIPTFIRCRIGPIQSPTTTHPHIRSIHSRSASVISWVPGSRFPAEVVKPIDRNASADTIPSVSDVPVDLEKSTETLHNAELEKGPEPEYSHGRTNSLRSFTRLGSLTGKPPSFLPSRTRSRQGHYPQETDWSGVTVQTSVSMSWEERRKAMDRDQSYSRSREDSISGHE